MVPFTEDRKQMEGEFPASDIQSHPSLQPTAPPPTAPPLGVGWTADVDRSTEAAAAQTPLDWSPNLQLHREQQQAMQAMQGHHFGTSITTAGSLPIPAHWGAGSTGLLGAGSCESAALPPFAATWPLPEHGQPVMPSPMQPPLHWDAQQAGELQAAVAMEPWNSSWPVQPLHGDQAYVPGAASDGMAMPPPVYGPYPYFPGDQYLPPPPPYLLQHQVCPGTWTAHQQPYALQQPAFAISPPAPAQAAGQGRLVARRKKAALPAEPSFGCDSGNLEGGNSAVLLLSAEASQAPEEIAAAAAASTETQLVAATQHSRAALLAAADAATSAEGSAEPAAQPAQPSIAFDKAPRAVEWRPYSLTDYRQKRYDAKQAAATYWVLGGLGPGQPPSEQAGKRERQKQFGQVVRRCEEARLGVPRRRAAVLATKPRLLGPCTPVTEAQTLASS